MGNEITVEELAAATDAVKRAVQQDIDVVPIYVGGKYVKYQIVAKSASDSPRYIPGDGFRDFPTDPGSQLNAMAIARIDENGNPDYGNVAVVFAGTNSPPVDEGKSGFPTAIGAVFGLSGEYAAAKQFLETAQDAVGKKDGGKITNVSGFSQAGGYMMKLSAEYGRKGGFRTVAFDDWGGDQFDTLTEKEQNWLLQNPGQLIRYQYDSFASLSGRDDEFGTVIKLSRTAHNDRHSKYFNGDALDMDALIKDGLFGPGMTEAQVRDAAKTWGRLYSGSSDVAGNPPENFWIDKKLMEYLDRYGSYGTGKFSLAGGAGTVSLSTDFAVTGPALISAAIEYLEQVKILNDDIPEKIEQAYNILLDTCTSQFMGLVDRYDLEEEASSRGILPSEVMNLSAIEDVSQKVDGEIEDLMLLNAAVVSVAAKRKAEDEAEANEFGF